MNTWRKDDVMEQGLVKQAKTETAEQEERPGATCQESTVSATGADLRISPGDQLPSRRSR